jgi:hypothetical protein
VSLPPDDLATWYRAQLDEDERVAREAEGGWITLGPDPERANSVGRHAARWDPARVLAEVDAKRRIIRLYVNAKAAYDAGSISLRNRTQDEAAEDVLGVALRALALPYVDRPGYREEWKP